jgi:3-oxoacyl-[acyl-carrier protein] reductase
MDLKLQGKRALVTGSSSGIGEAIAKTLASEGLSVVVHGRKQAEAERAAQAIRASGGKAVVVLGDLATDAGAARVAGEALAAFGGIDVLVNNAGAYAMDDWSNPDPAA